MTTMSEPGEAIISTDLLNATNELMLVRKAKKELENELKEAKEIEDEIEKQIIHFMQLQGLNSFSNEDCHISRRIKNTPRLDSYDELIDFIIKEMAFDLLQKRLSTVAVRERWEAGIVVPGVSCFVEEDLTIRENK